MSTCPSPLDPLGYPHIVDDILFQLPPPALNALRNVNSALREYIDLVTLASVELTPGRALKTRAGNILNLDLTALDTALASYIRHLRTTALTHRSPRLLFGPPPCLPNLQVVHCTEHTLGTHAPLIVQTSALYRTKRQYNSTITPIQYAPIGLHMNLAVARPRHLVWNWQFWDEREFPNARLRKIRGEYFPHSLERVTIQAERVTGHTPPLKMYRGAGASTMLIDLAKHIAQALDRIEFTFVGTKDWATSWIFGLDPMHIPTEDLTFEELFQYIVLVELAERGENVQPVMGRKVPNLNFVDEDDTVAERLAELMPSAWLPQRPRVERAQEGCMYSMDGLHERCTRGKTAYN